MIITDKRRKKTLLNDTGRLHGATDLKDEFKLVNEPSNPSTPIPSRVNRAEFLYVWLTVRRPFRGLIGHGLSRMRLPTRSITRSKTFQLVIHFIFHWFTQHSKDRPTRVFLPSSSSYIQSSPGPAETFLRLVDYPTPPSNPRSPCSDFRSRRTHRRSTNPRGSGR